MIKFRLTVISFLQFFIWGCWLITIGAYWFNNKKWDSTEFGVIFSTMGLASLFMPAITGILADKLIPAQKLYGLLHLLGAIGLFFIPQANSPQDMFWIILATMIFYMPTISLSNTVAYHILSTRNFDVIKSFPPIRVWGTVGFICALWTVSLTKNETSANQFYLASFVSIFLGIFSFTLPDCPPLGKQKGPIKLASIFGLSAFQLLKNRQFAVFFTFSMLLGAALQLTNAYGDTFLHEFSSKTEYAQSLAVKYPAMIMSISQISETLFILAIPFFMRRFGIKQVMLISMIAWVLRFALFAYGNPGSGLWMIVLSCIIYGMAFDFFNISGSLFIEQSANKEIRSSAQGLFTTMVNGVGAVFGSLSSGYIIQHFFINQDGSKQWNNIWMTFAIYALIVAIAFVFLFKDSKQKVWNN
jgi:NHS family xanthosine MFS transporter